MRTRFVAGPARAMLLAVGELAARAAGKALDASLALNRLELAAMSARRRVTVPARHGRPGVAR